MDWNNDGRLDILSGCYWSDDAQAGHINLLLGLENGQFAAAVPLLTVAGEPLVNVPVSDGETAAESDEETNPGDDIEWNNICTHQHAVDYDGDGDLDLVTGDIGSTFFLVENTGNDETQTLAAEPQMLNVSSPGAHSSPHLVDWDGDGDLDLLTGSADGGAFLSENIGTRTEPQWSDFKSLIPISRSGTQSVRGGPMVPGTSTRLWVVDWNQDGKLDILLGDSVTLSDRKEGLTDSEYASLKAAYDQRVQEAQATYTEKSKAFFDAESAGEPSDELKEALEAAQLDFSAVFQSKSDFITERRTGHVWLFLQTD